jgi:Uma2 family endonuclease
MHWRRNYGMISTRHYRLPITPVKRGDYAEGRVPEYWIVNPQTETITVLRLRGDAYEEVGIYHRGEAAASVLLTDFSIAVAAVFNVD